MCYNCKLEQKYAEEKRIYKLGLCFMPSIHLLALVVILGEESPPVSQQPALTRISISGNTAVSP